MVTVPATSLNLPLFQHRCEHSETKNVHLQLPLMGRTIPIIVRGAVSLLLIGIHYQTKGGLSCKLNITTSLEKNGLCVDYPAISPSWDGSERLCCFCSVFSFSKFSPSNPRSRPECPERQSFRRTCGVTGGWCANGREFSPQFCFLYTTVNTSRC